MKPLVIIVLIATIVSAFFDEDDTPTDVRVRYLSTVSSSFTDITKFNTWDHAHIPLGILEIEYALISLNLGYRRIKWTNRDNFDSTRVFNGLIAPNVRVGSPGLIYLDLNYSINPISIEDISQNPSTPLNRFGFSVVGQVEDGRFQIGISGQGFFGREKGENGNQRILMGGEDAGICMGFKLHDVVLLNVYGRASGYMDSLYLEDDNEKYPQERFGYLQLPQINVAIDVGDEDIPYQSNLCITYAHNNFVYTGKISQSIPIFIKYYDTLNNDTVLSENNAGADVDPLVSDSVAWHWKNIWTIEVNDDFGLNPALHLGSWHSKYKHMEPNGDNYPINYDGERPGWEWKTGSFSFGLGCNWRIMEILKLWLEYSYTTLKLEITGNKLSDFEVPDNNGYNRLGFGMKTNFHKFPTFSSSDELFGLFFTFGFLFMQENELTATYRSEPFRHMYPSYENVNDLNVQLNRYQPWVTMENELKTINVSFGLGATFLENIFETVLHFGILRQEYTAGREDKYKGFEFGIDLIYNKFGEKKSTPDKQIDKAKDTSQTIGTERENNVESSDQSEESGSDQGY